MEAPERWQIPAAAKYEKFVATWFAAWASDLVERARLQPGWRVLDLACGTGIVARAAGPAVGRSGAIVGSDLNQEMLEEAQRHPVDGAPVDWRQADATDLPFETAEFDAVLSQQGLQFMPDKSAAVGEMRRVLRPGGIAAVSVWRSPEHNPYIAALADGLTQHVSPEAGETMLAPCRLGDLGELIGYFERAGFRSVEAHEVTLHREPSNAREAIEGNLTALPISDQVAAMDVGAHSAMIDDMVGALGKHIANGDLAAPNSAHVAIAVV